MLELKLLLIYIYIFFLLKISIMIIFWSLPGWSRIVQTVRNINTATDNVVKISEKTDKALTYVSKATGVSTGAAKGTIDMMEAIACQDGVCADGLSIATSFIPGPNVTTLVTLPVSVFCKVFVHCCKRAKKYPGVVNFNV